MIYGIGKKTLKISPDTFVKALYVHLLNREPSRAEVSEHVKTLSSGELDASTLLVRFVQSEEYTQRADLTSHAFINAHDQFGEIGMLLREWATNSVSEKIVVDVGARGRERSNSYDLMLHFGWRGLLVEANPALLLTIEVEFKGLDCTLVGTAVSDYTGVAEFTIGSNDDVSSLNPDAAASWGETRGTINVDVRRLPDILADYKIPHRFGLLSVDIEGEDVKVLSDLICNSDYRPDYIIIEASQDFQITTLEQLDLPDQVCQSYQIFDQTRANLLMRRVWPPCVECH
ncbi:MAG: FkbM family methyltransferase [Sulfitobacter sp.]